MAVIACHDAFWPTTFWMFAGEAFFGAAPLASPELLRKGAAAVLVAIGAWLVSG